MGLFCDEGWWYSFVIALPFFVRSFGRLLFSTAIDHLLSYMLVLLNLGCLGDV